MAAYLLAPQTHTVRALVARSPERFPLELGLQLAQEIVGVLSSAHEAGVVLGLLDSSNLEVCPNGAVRVLGGCGAALAPELGRGATADVRSDVYAAGCVLFEVFTGLTLAQAKATQPASELGVPPPPSRFAPSIDEGLDQLLVAMLSREPAERPESMHLVQARVLACLDELGLEPSREAIARFVNPGSPSDAAATTAPLTAEVATTAPLAPEPPATEALAAASATTGPTAVESPTTASVPERQTPEEGDAASLAPTLIDLPAFAPGSPPATVSAPPSTEAPALEPAAQIPPGTTAMAIPLERTQVAAPAQEATLPQWPIPAPGPEAVLPVARAGRPKPNNDGVTVVGRLRPRGQVTVTARVGQRRPPRSWQLEDDVEEEQATAETAWKEAPRFDAWAMGAIGFSAMALVMLLVM